jgi:choline dehydrogenase
LEEVRPGTAVGDDESLHRYIYATADSLFHAVGTRAMGMSPDSVATSDLRVRGVEALRVIDASVMPLVLSGNTTAAVLMIAERAADLMLGRRSSAGGASPPSGRQ